jgi:ribonucleoside-diphosphate reductase beta chain
MKVLGGLTLLDTVQGGVGMPQIMEHVDGLQRKAVLGFMGMMEQIHAKSYSSIFTTLATTEEIDSVFRWVEENPLLQTKAGTISQYYKAIESKKTCISPWQPPCCWRATCSTADFSIRYIWLDKAR